MGVIADQLNSDSLAIRQAGSRALERIAVQQLENIKRRLDAGISSRGTRFIDYAPSTAKRKGRRRPVNLLDEGNMRGAMYVRRNRLNSYDITWRDRENERIARFQHAGTRRRTPKDAKARARAQGTRRIVRNTGAFHIPPRPFMEATDEEVNQADRLFGVVVDSQFPTDLRRRIKINFTI